MRHLAINQKNYTTILVFFILLIGIVLRYKSIWFGYPLITHPDEPNLVYRAGKMLQSMDFNPHFFNYPTLIIYLQVLVVAVVGGFEHYILQIPTADIQLIDFFIAGRIVASIASTISIYFIYIIGTKLANSKVGLLASFIVAISPLHIENSAYVTTDIWVSIFFIFIIFFSIKIYENNTLSNYLLAGIFLGFAISSKYTAVLFSSSILMAHLLVNKFDYKQIFVPKIIISAITSIGVFFLTTPYSILDYKTFFKDIAFESHHYHSGHAGNEAIGNHSWDLYFNYLLSDSGIGYIAILLATISLFFIFKKENRVFLIIFVPIALFFLFIGNYKVYFPRNVVSLIPVIAILSASSIYLISKYFNNLKININFLYILVPLAIMFNIGAQAIDDIKNKNLPDTRWETLKWIKHNIPSGSKIALDEYCPRVDKYDDRLEVIKLGVGGIYKDKDKIDNSIKYVITSSYSYERFFNKKIDKSEYKEISQGYTKFFKNNELVYEIEPEKNLYSGPIIKIFKHKID